MFHVGCRPDLRKSPDSCSVEKNPRLHQTDSRAGGPLPLKGRPVLCFGFLKIKAGAGGGVGGAQAPPGPPASAECGTKGQNAALTEAGARGLLLWVALCTGFLLSVALCSLWAGAGRRGGQPYAPLCPSDSGPHFMGSQCGRAPQVLCGLVGTLPWDCAISPPSLARMGRDGCPRPLGDGGGHRGSVGELNGWPWPHP